MRSATAAGILALLATSLAHADAIDPVPACPPGSRGASSHAGQWCVPAPCTSDAECSGGACRPWRVCTRPAMVMPGGLHPGPAQRMELVIGTCEPARACTGAEEPPPPIVGTFEPDAPTCVESRFCVPAALPALPARGSVAPAPSSPLSPPPRPPSASARGCACAAATSAESIAAPWAVVLVLATIAGRRRR